MKILCCIILCCCLSYDILSFFTLNFTMFSTTLCHVMCSGCAILYLSHHSPPILFYHFISSYLVLQRHIVSLYLEFNYAVAFALGGILLYCLAVKTVGLWVSVVSCYIALPPELPACCNARPREDRAPGMQPKGSCSMVASGLR